MYSVLLLSLLAAAVAGTRAQDGPASGMAMEVSDTTPPEGDYTGPLRPQIHFSPPSGFMNDPNGLFVDSEGVWHLYYQYNPTELVAGNQHWGHATSEDLYHWVNQPIAIFPENESEGIFSGSIVVDENNTSGLFPGNQTNGVVAIYTLHTPEEETQDLAVSFDGGYQFEKFQGNPVLSVGSDQFRDPKVIWHEATQKWIMVVAYAQEFTIGFFSSPNLKDWTAVSNFSNHGLLGLQWECPNLVQIPAVDAEDPNATDEQMWMLLLSINPGAPLGGSTTQYYPGSFNGTHFEAVDNAARILDFGKDNYASQFFYGVPAGDTPVSIAWASNWQYAQRVPTGPQEGFRSAMSLPRTHALLKTRNDWILTSSPWDLTLVLDEPLARNGELANDELRVDFSDLDSKAVYFEIELSDIPEASEDSPASATANFTFTSSQSDDSLSGGYYLYGDAPFWIDRGGIRGFEDPFFTDKFSTNKFSTDVSFSDKAVFRMVGVLDRSVFEVFLQQGEQSATISLFPEQPLDQLVVRTGDLPDGVVASSFVVGINSVWDKESR